MVTSHQDIKMNNEPELILDEIRQLISKNKNILISIEPERKKLQEEHNRIWNLLRAESKKPSSSSNRRKELKDKYFIISKKLNDPKYRIIHDEINNRNQKILELKKRFESQKAFKEGYESRGRKKEFGDLQIYLKKFVKFINNQPKTKNINQGGRPRGQTRRTIDRYKKVFHQYEILNKKYSSKTKAELYELLATRDYDGKTYTRKTIRNIIEDKKYNLIPSQ